ncbi:MAG: phytoene desaturase family protein [Hyphomicrobium sp.]
MSPHKQYDVVIVGGGHNALTCAGYLARARLKVVVLEARHIVGGAAISEEFYPGFTNSVCSYSVSLLHPKIIRELDLERHGLKIVLRNSAGFVPLESGDALYLSRDKAQKMAELDRFAPGDGDAYFRFEDMLSDVAGALRWLTLQTPPNLGGGLADVLKILSTANGLKKLRPASQRAFIDMMAMSAGDFLNEWFGGGPIKGLYGYNSIVGNFQSIYAPGSAYVVLHHNFGEVNGILGAWGHAIGGMGSISQAMAKSARAHGADIEVNARVKEILIDRGEAVGAVTVDGRVFRGRKVAAGVNPKLLFDHLIDPAAVSEDFSRTMQGWRCRSGTFRMNVALSELPNYTCRPGTDLQEHHTASMIIAPSLDYLERAYDDAKYGSWSKRPVIEMNINSTIDPTLAPPGQHVASLFCQHFHPELDGQDWDDVKDQAADLIIDTITTYAPNFKASVIGRQALSPKDLERTFGLVGGDIFHGALHLDQIYSLRPAAGFAAYRMPVKNLYLCGSGAHPGGGVSGLPGHNAAREILADFKTNLLGRLIGWKSS